MESWKGKIAVVTGASSGIGKAIAIALLKHGVHVAGLSRRLDKMNEIKQELSECTTAGKFLPVECDVTKMNDVKNAFDKIIKSYGVPDALINNAGVVRMSELMSMDIEEARLIFETNVLAVIAMTKEALTYMNSEGIIININSIVGHSSETLFGYGAYSGSKHALTRLTQSLRTELSLRERPIRVTSISPGPVATELVASVANNASSDPDTKIALLTAEDIAECVIFVLSLPSRVNISEIIVEPRDFCQLKISSGLIP